MSCPVNDNASRTSAPSLPLGARLPINRCNLPAVILGSLTFQRHPAPIYIDGVLELHRSLFEQLEYIDEASRRAERFMDHMDAHFLLKSPDEAGFTTGGARKRHRADYLRMVRGWSFDSDGREGAVLKGWAESRFGLLPRRHRESILHPSDPAYLVYLEARTSGLYNTNALEAQLDLLYTYCQYELQRTISGATHLTLHRGVNRPDEHEVLETMSRSRRVVVLNNLNSFTDHRERADEFGDVILTAAVPLSKIFFYNRLLPGMLKGEDEFVVIGGVYEVELSTL